MSGDHAACLENSFILHQNTLISVLIKLILTKNGQERFLFFSPKSFTSKQIELGMAELQKALSKEVFFIGSDVSDFIGFTYDKSDQLELAASIGGLNFNKIIFACSKTPIDICKIDPSAIKDNFINFIDKFSNTRNNELVIVLAQRLILKIKIFWRLKWMRIQTVHSLFTTLFYSVPRPTRIYIFKSNCKTILKHYVTKAWLLKYPVFFNA